METAMSVVPIVKVFDTSPRHPIPFAKVFGLIDGFATWVVAEIRVRRDMRRLAGFSDYMLRDIGIARSDIEGAVRRGRDDSCE
jgi:uncharacterized protein YjiS (DUF1127 family)